MCIPLAEESARSAQQTADARTLLLLCCRSLLLCYLGNLVEESQLLLATLPPPRCDIMGKGNDGKDDASGLKEAGNKAFASGDLEQARTVRIGCIIGQSVVIELYTAVMLSHKFALHAKKHSATEEYVLLYAI